MPFVPSLLEPISEDLARLRRLLALLEVERDEPTRADLAQELVHEAAILEDTNDRAVYPFLEEVGCEDVATDLRKAGESLRSAMEPVFSALHHSVPMDAHFNDENLNQEIDRVCSRAREHLDREVEELARVQSQIDRHESEHIRGRLRSARRHAVDRPRPSVNPIRREITRFTSVLDRHFPDTGKQHRPGREKLGD